MIACKTKQLRNSIGVILPKDIIRRKNIKPNEWVLVGIKEKKNVLKELFEALHFKKPTKTLIEESRRILGTSQRR